MTRSSSSSTTPGSKCELCDSGACDGGVGASVALEFMPKRNSELIGIRG